MENVHVIPNGLPLNAEPIPPLLYFYAFFLYARHFRQFEILFLRKRNRIFLVFSSLLFSFHLTHPSIRKRNTFGSKFNFFIERTKFHTDSIPSNDTPQEIGRSNGRVKPRDILPNYLLPLRPTRCYGIFY